MTSILDNDPTPIDRPCGFVPAQTVGEWWRGMSAHEQGMAAANAVGGFAGYTWERESRSLAAAFRALVGDPPPRISEGLAALMAAIYSTPALDWCAWMADPLWTMLGWPVPEWVVSYDPDAVRSVAAAYAFFDNLPQGVNVAQIVLDELDKFIAENPDAVDVDSTDLPRRPPKV